MDLNEARERIRAVDEAMAALFEKRMAAAEEVADYKAAHGLPVEDLSQEARVIAGRSALIGDPAVRALYVDYLQNMMELSKRWQRRRMPPGPGLHMELGARGYDIVVERGCLARAGELLCLDRRVLIVTDEGVPAQYAAAVASACREPLVFTVPQGEGSKSLATLETLLEAMLSAGFTRGDCVCAVGGGVPGDLAGFAAASYQRGVDFYNVPTTLLSQVDSSIGGKTAVNLGGVKNIVGAFWQPKKVLIDPDTLKTLPARTLACGMAEAVKTALIGDAALFELFEAGRAAQETETVIARSLAVKKAVVEADERESGLRKTLNFGHSIGHAIEAVTGLPHGACVALGMLPMCSDAVRARLLPVLEGLGLPTQVRADPEAVYAELLHDKKMGDGGITAVFVETPGQCELRQVPPEALRAGIEMVVKA